VSVYSLEKLISETRRLAAEYRRTTGKPLPGVSNEIAEYDAAKLLNLELVQDRSDGYDAVGKGAIDGRRVQIKARAIFDESKSGHRIGQLKTEKAWDMVVLVVMNENYDVVEIFKADRGTLIKNIGENRNKRGAMSVAKFKNIGQLVWDDEQGLIEDALIKMSN
jgi:hypothetical protein